VKIQALVVGRQMLTLYKVMLALRLPPTRG